MSPQLTLTHYGLKQVKEKMHCSNMWIFWDSLQLIEDGGTRAIQMTRSFPLVQLQKAKMMMTVMMDDDDGEGDGRNLPLSSAG